MPGRQPPAAEDRQLRSRRLRRRDTPADRDSKSGCERTCARVARVGFLRERSLQHAVEGERHSRHRRRHGEGLFDQVRLDHRDLGLLPKRRLPDEAVEGHAPERVHVGPPVERLTLNLLRRAVFDRAHEGARLRQAVGHPPLGDSEVREEDLSAGFLDQDVGGLHISVYEPGRVSRVERRRHALDDVRRPLRRQASLTAKHVS